MLSELTIPKKNTQLLAMDREQLYAIGLKHIQQLSSQIWTDYNVHDPGITTLELLSYALTDLSYRASLPIADLLASESDNAAEMQKQFFTARQILPNRPLTLLDYRKLLIDIDGVKNAWLQPASLSYYADIINPFNPDLENILDPPRLGCATLFVNDIIDLLSLAIKLNEPAESDRLSQYLKSRLTATTQKAISDYQSSSEDLLLEQLLKTLLVQDLNQIIQNTIVQNGVTQSVSLYDAQRFANVILSDRTQRLLGLNIGETDIERLNRMLLEDAYPEEISQNQWLRDKSNFPSLKKVNLAGLYQVKIQYENEMTAATKPDVIQAVQQKLQANRNLCEDFVHFNEVETLSFQLCAELELAPDADVTKVNNTILSQVQEYLSPSVRFYTLSEMLIRRKTDGTSYTVDEIFDGSALDNGFIDDDELENADLRTEIRLSDIISIIMDIAGVQAVRDIVINPEGNQVPLVNKWVIPVDAGKQAKLNQKLSRLVFYKRNMPVVARATTDAPSKAQPATVINDLEIPLGTYRDLANYYSFQNHFPAIYGLSDVGLSSTADDKRKALAYQLKAYLLFFDRIMANYMAQLSHVKELFSTNPELPQTYFYQVVNSFVGYNKIYRSTFVTQDFIKLASFVDKLKARSDEVSQFLWSNFSAETQQSIADYTGEDGQNEPLKTALVADLNQIIQASSIYDPPRFANVQIAEETRSFLEQNPQDDALILLNRLLLQDAYPLEIAKWNGENKTKFEERRNRFLDHLIARFAERFHDFANTIYSAFGENSANIIHAKCEFLRNYPTISSDRALAYNYSLTDEKDLWNSENVSGLEKRLAKLLDIRNPQRRNLSDSDEGMYLIENILLRPEENTDPFLPICPTPNCTDCAEIDPYSYRIHVILPAYTSRFSNMHFRRFVEAVIRSETPAHILPKICWIDRENMVELEKLYRDWIYLKAGVEKTNRGEKLGSFINKLFKVKNVYERQKLRECDSSEDELKFILGRTALGTKKKIETE